MAGNIGNPILSEKKYQKKLYLLSKLFLIKLNIVKLFKTNYAAILNISPDHIERHGSSLKITLNQKFKLIKNQKKGIIIFR